MHFAFSTNIWIQTGHHSQLYFMQHPGESMRLYLKKKSNVETGASFQKIHSFGSHQIVFSKKLKSHSCLFNLSMKFLCLFFVFNILFSPFKSLFSLNSDLLCNVLFVWFAATQCRSLTRSRFQSSPCVSLFHIGRNRVKN